MNNRRHGPANMSPRPTDYWDSTWSGDWSDYWTGRFSRSDFPLFVDIFIKDSTYRNVHILVGSKKLNLQTAFEVRDLDPSLEYTLYHEQDITIERSGVIRADGKQIRLPNPIYEMIRNRIQYGRFDPINGNEESGWIQKERNK